MNQVSQEYAYKILIVDDVADNLELLSTALAEQGYQVSCAKNDSMALIKARNDLPDLILLDINLSGLNGDPVWEQLQADEITQTIPVIFLSTQEDIRDRIRALTTGSVDFISKPFSTEEVLIRVKNQLALQAANARVQTLDRELERQVKERISQLELANSLLKQEILQSHQLEEKLRYDALHDSLTGLPNRSLFMEQLKNCLYDAIENADRQFAVLFIDLDRFKMINDSLGHLAGDELLIACAQRLENCIYPETTLARLGGDEFTILLDKIKDVKDAVAVAEKILQEFTSSFNLGHRSLLITVTIGIAVGNSEYEREIDLLRDADTALYRAKELGKARYEIFDRQMYLDAMNRLELENELRQAILHQELVLFYQPIYALDSRQLIGFEALVRWQHPTKGLLSPDEFVSLAEETGSIVPLGQWVMERACRQLKNWQDCLPPGKSLTMSINVAGRQLNDPNFLATVDRIIAQTQVDSQYLKFEIVESMLVENTEQLIELLHQIKNRQIQLSLDDFGTGYSSLSYLPQFPIDILKIDRSFVEAMNVERQNLEIIKTIITLAQVLHLKVIAEGIETEEQSKTLQTLKAEFGQGYLFAKPLSAEAATLMIQRHSNQSLLTD